MSWFDLITGALGQQNPYDEASAWSDATQKRNRAAVGLDANGNPLPTNADGTPVTPPADPNNPVNNGQSAAMGQALASGVQQPGQQPQATKTDPSLGHILMDMTQYQQREQGFNQAMGAGFAAFSQPRDREWVSKVFNVNEPDPTKLMQQEQDLASQQQGQDRMNSLGAMISGPQGAQIAQSLNISQADLIARYRADPQGVGTMIQNFRQPTDQMKNLEQIDSYINQVAPQIKSAGGSDSTLSDLRTLMRAGVAGDKAQAMVLAQDAFHKKFGQDPSWKNNPDAFAIYQAQQAGRSEALDKQPLSEGKVSDLENKVDAIENDPALPGLMKRLVPGQGILSLVGYNDAERGLLQKIKQATSDEYVRGLADPGLGTRKTQQEMTYVGQSLGGVLNASNINFSDYKAGLERLKDQLYRTHADIYGQSGNFNGLDPKYHGFVNDAYRPGGPLNEGIEGAPARKPLDDDAKQFWTQNQGKVPKAAMIEHLRNLNYDTSGLK